MNRKNSAGQCSDHVGPRRTHAQVYHREFELKFKRNWSAFGWPKWLALKEQKKPFSKKSSVWPTGELADEVAL